MNTAQLRLMWKRQTTERVNALRAHANEFAADFVKQGCAIIAPDFLTVEEAGLWYDMVTDAVRRLKGWEKKA